MQLAALLYSKLERPAPQRVSLAMLLKGDLPGHEFHGNQWTDGAGNLIPDKIVGLHLRHREAANRLNEPWTAPTKNGISPTTAALKTQVTMSFRRLNQAVLEHTSNDQNRALALMRDMNTESSRREKETSKLERVDLRKEWAASTSATSGITDYSSKRRKSKRVRSRSKP